MVDKCAEFHKITLNSKEVMAEVENVHNNNFAITTPGLWQYFDFFSLYNGLAEGCNNISN